MNLFTVVLDFIPWGSGHTWYLKAVMLEESAPTSHLTKFLEAIGLGDIGALDRMRESLTHSQLQDVTLNELTPFQIAFQCHQPGSASWLLDQGVLPDILSLWDLGWKDKVPALLNEHPELVKRDSGRWTSTPLHYAIQRGDMELVKLLLTVPNDLDAKDAVFRSTLLGWASHFQRQEMLVLRQKHDAANPLTSVRAALESILGTEQIRSDLASTKTEK